MGRMTTKKKLTSPELLEQVCQENKDIKRDFLSYLKSTQHSQGTIDSYANDIDIWCVWNLQQNWNKPFTEMTKRNLIAYQNWLIYDNGNSPARVKRLKSTLSSMSSFIEDILDDEYKDFRPIIAKVKSPTGQAVREKTVFTEDELICLMDALTAKKKYAQACAVALAMYGGRRKSELLRFKVNWFTDENVIYGSLYKTPEKVKTKGHGDGKYIYCYTLKHDFQPYFESYMKWREDNGIESEWLFYDKSNPSEPMQISTLNSWANTFSKITGKDFYFHCLRHFFATKLSESGLPDSVIQSIVGWESADMVRVYVDTSVDDVIGQYFNEDGIKKDIEQVGLSDL